jgi:DNA repair exonuclease SbcCD ATPase subunit
MMNEEKTRDDLHGRINSFDQNLRSLERRLRAVERRLSMEVPPQDLMDDPVHLQADLLQQMRTEFAELREQISFLDGKASYPGETDINALKQQMEELQEQLHTLSEGHQLTKHELLNNKTGDHMLTLAQTMKDQVEDMEKRLKRTEDRNRITIGSVKVPVELSGVVAAALIFFTGLLIMGNRWDIIRSPYFSFSIALVLAGAALLRFYMANKEPERT